MEFRTEAERIRHRGKVSAGLQAGDHIWLKAEGGFYLGRVCSVARKVQVVFEKRVPEIEGSRLRRRYFELEEMAEEPFANVVWRAVPRGRPRGRGG